MRQLDGMQSGEEITITCSKHYGAQQRQETKDMFMFGLKPQPGPIWGSFGGLTHNDRLTFTQKNSLDSME